MFRNNFIHNFKINYKNYSKHKKKKKMFRNNISIFPFFKKKFLIKY